jgi:hypothetical protein
LSAKYYAKPKEPVELDEHTRAELAKEQDEVLEELMLTEEGARVILGALADQYEWLAPSMFYAMVERAGDIFEESLMEDYRRAVTGD